MLQVTSYVLNSAALPEAEPAEGTRRHGKNTKLGVRTQSGSLISTSDGFCDSGQVIQLLTTWISSLIAFLPSSGKDLSSIGG